MHREKTETTIGIWVACLTYIERRGNMSVVIADVSHHNNVNYFSNDIDGVIIRASYGENGVDKKLEQYVKKAELANVPYGFYHFSYAVSQSGAERNAMHFLNTIQGYTPTLPCAIDIENDQNNKTLSTMFTTNNKELFTKIAKTELEILESAGHYAMLYGNTWDLMYISSNESIRERYALWVASWKSKRPTFPTMKLWQHTATGRIDGIEGNVDLSLGDDSFLHLVDRMKTGNVSREIFQTGDTVTTTADYDVYGTHLASFIKQVNLYILGYKEEVDAYIVSTNGKDVTAVIARDRLRRV